MRKKSGSLEKIPEPQTVAIIDPKQQDVVSVPLPAGAKAGVWEEAPSSLCPVADWQTPGDWIAGKFLGIQTGVGPNKSRLYHVETEIDGKRTRVGFWGCTILDTKFDMACVPDLSFIMVQYIGTINTSRGLNPAKNFRVLYRKPEPV